MAPDAGHAAATRGRSGAGLAVWLLAVAGLAVSPATAATGADPDSGEAVPAAASIDTLRGTVGLRWEASPRATLPGAPSTLPRSNPAVAPPFDYRLWVGNRRTEFGIGLPSSSPLVVALRHQLTPQTRLVIDTELRGGSDALAAPAQRRPFGIELEASRWHGLAKGTLLRAPLSLHSSIALRLRGGRLGLYLQVRINGDE